MAPKMAFILLTLIVVAAVAPNPNSSEDDAVQVIQDTEITFILTEDICMNGHRSSYMSSHCCKMHPDVDNDTEYCASKLKGVHASTKIEHTILYSRLSECIYKKKKYIKDERTLNIGHIKADAAKLKDPLQQKYMVDMYRSCAREAKKEFNAINEAAKDSKDQRQLLQNMHKPYFLFVYSCSLFYSAKHQCPYFRWFGEEEGGTKCERYTRECKTLVNKYR